MTHPLIPQIIDLATPIAQDLGLEVVSAVFQTHQNPPVLRVDIRNPQTDTSLNDCEQMSRALEAMLDSLDAIPEAYVLEVSSPGISRTLTTDREFIAFKGFAVQVETDRPFEGRQKWLGQLVGRDETTLHLSRKGRLVAIPRSWVTQVKLDDRA
jgi:ribosome maturation factor RimP